MCVIPYTHAPNTARQQGIHRRGGTYRERLVQARAEAEGAAALEAAIKVCVCLFV